MKRCRAALRAVVLINVLHSQNMDAVPLLKSKSLRAYVRFLRGIGAPVDSGLRRARLPTLFEEHPEAWVSYASVMSFLADMADREDLPDLGLRVGTKVVEQQLITAVSDPLFCAPTLFDALQRIPSICTRQNTHLRAWLEPYSDRLRFCISLPFSLETPGRHIAEAHALDLTKMVVRGFAGPSFEPMRILLASRARDLRFPVETRYRGVPVKTDQPYSAIEIPRALLCSTRASADNPAQRASNPESRDALPCTFAQSMEACLELYLLECYPPVALAAEIMGCSVRTLQRSLAAEHTTYRDLIEKVRCLSAISQLRTGNESIADLAMKLGYSEHSAFTRAFRRWTGSSPTEYRICATQTPMSFADQGASH
jgi:AraC-like DNA-binding protein